MSADDYAPRKAEHISDRHAEMRRKLLGATTPGSPPGDRLGELDVWLRVIAAATAAVELFPADTKQTVHRFAAETVLKAMFNAARKRGVRIPEPIWLSQSPRPE